VFTNLERLRTLAPNDTFIDIIDAADISLAKDAEVAIGAGSTSELPALVELAPHLKWFACVAAGVERLVEAGLIGRPGLTVTKNSGPQDIPIAEHALALLLAVAKRMREYGRAQEKRRWTDELPHAELAGATAVVFGLGSIGRQVARSLSALGVRVVGVRRSGGTVAMPEVSRVVGPDGLASALRGADYLVIAAPLTPWTRGAISAPLMDLMKPTAIIVNVARGAIIDEPAMIERLRTARLGGAALDVVGQEPLAPDSALWDLPNVVLTPHVASSSPFAAERTMLAFVENLARWKRDEPLANVVDADRGY